jgi:hypothetical protein
MARGGSSGASHTGICDVGSSDQSVSILIPKRNEQSRHRETTMHHITQNHVKRAKPATTKVSGLKPQRRPGISGQREARGGGKGDGGFEEY